MAASASSPVDFLLRHPPPRRRRPPLAGAFFAPTGLAGAPLLRALASLAASMLGAPRPLSQRRNLDAFMRRLALLSALLDSLLLLDEGEAAFSDSANICFRELYVVLFRADLLVSYVASAGCAWAVLRGPHLAASFRDLDAELAVVLDVLPAASLRLSRDAVEHLDLLRARCRRRAPGQYHDHAEAALRDRLLAALRQFELGQPSDPSKFQSLLAHIGISDAASCRAEIEYLEEQILSQEEDTDLPLVGGIVALLRYCLFSLFDPGNTKAPRVWPSAGNRQRLLSWSCSDDTSFSAPKEFSCPISLDLMCDPVVVSTGQTYDRPSIIQWIEEGHSTCPSSGQALADNQLMPNHALRSLISQWCRVHGFQYDSPENNVGMMECVAASSSSMAAIEANKATARILVRMLEEGSDSTKLVAAREIRLLAKSGKQNRAFIAELGAIPLLCKLLLSSDWMEQENAVTALLNLSIYEPNKTQIIEQDGCLRLIVSVLKNGWTTEAKENAAATLFSLSVVHDYKKMIMNEPGAVEELACMLTKGTPRGKKDAVMALFNLSTHPESSSRMLESCAALALIESLRNDTVSEEAAGALALLMKQPSIVHLVGSSETVITSLVGLMRRGTPKGKENAVSALYEICRRGGSTLAQRVAMIPGLNTVIQNITLTGTKRARKKASLIVKICQRSQMPSAMTLGSSLTVVDRPLVGNNTLRRAASFGSGELSNPMSISVPVP
ncbi:U-box domain-containing protein 4-like [Phragmites australis]|uniref:U-box domain-containing protein 4-like n=1 Tax=Phragmites australis TaxID=29695 RepID=UPI002D797A19|nr:U-box domain-containing protein 4-like [Phragmites australis]